MRPWKEFFRVLFDQDVAAISLTDFDGRIVDCNERCAQIFGFASRVEMLGHSAWDFYFDRNEREVLIERLRWRGSCPAEEVCYRDRNGRPIWLLASYSLAGSADGQPELILSTAIEIAAHREAGLVSPELSASTPEEPCTERDRMAGVSQKLTRLLQRAGQILHEDNLPKMDKAEIRDVLLVLEEIKMLMSELEIIRLPQK